jgi:serine phosphatase RsbU (regulator of sigma subunit)
MQPALRAPCVIMTSMDAPPDTKRRGISPAFVVWLSGIALILVLHYVDKVLDRFGRTLGPFELFSFFAWLVVIALTLYGFAVFSRWVLSKLFWTVGRRLFLSYVMIGVLPFFLFAILLFAILYVIAGVASQASYRMERQNVLGYLEILNSDYSTRGTRPSIEGVEVYDTANRSGANLPVWLRAKSYSGIALRDKQPLLVSAHQYPWRDGQRGVVLALPIDDRFAKQIEERGGMISATTVGSREGRDSINIREEDAHFDKFIKRAIAFDRIFFFETTEEGAVLNWSDGTTDAKKRLFTLISNPYRNLVQYYFGGATNSWLMKIIFTIIAALAGTLMTAYFIATAFAAVLIFSISRAVNRIEKGTRAVERGDFSYRIKMKRNNQLGAMAQSFDRMTESIASLLATVSEKERLQSEIAIAATIQRNLLPREGPKFRGVSFSAHFEPTTSIGGDYYDVFNLDKTRLAVAIGDVSGHGLSTGLVMAMVKAAITTLVEEGADETSLFHRLNELVFRSTERRAFMTLAFTIFDLERGRIRHTNAGHLYPYVLRDGESHPRPIESPSLPLGVRANLTTHTVEVDLREGDTIVYLSDGIVEAQDENGEPFGFDQLESLLGSLQDRSPSAIRDGILDVIARHSGTRPADDDRTIMVLRFDSLLGPSAEWSGGLQPAEVTVPAG